VKSKVLFIILAAVAGLALIAGTPLAAEKTITIKGSTTVLPIAQACAETFMNSHLDISISVQGGGSGVGITSIIDGTADIGDASRPAKDKEFAKARENGFELYENVVAMDGIAVIVHPSNPLSALTKEQIKNIYTGNISNWKDLGGKAGKIVVVSRDSASGTFETFNELALDGEKVRPDALLNASNKAVATTIATTPQAIGYIGLGYLSNEVKGLKVDNVDPTKANVLNGSYSLSRKLFMYTRGEPKDAVKTFLDYVTSPEGQKLIDQAGFVGLK